MSLIILSWKIFSPYPLRSLLSARMMEAKRSNIPVTRDIPEEIRGGLP
ncbi:MAG: hypothetical protein ACLTM7_00880 [Streptococcus sp.]